MKAQISDHAIRSAVKQLAGLGASRLAGKLYTDSIVEMRKRLDAKVDDCESRSVPGGGNVS